MTAIKKVNFAGKPSKSLIARRRIDRGFVLFCVLTSCVSILILCHLLGTIFFQGWQQLDWQFITSPPRPDPDKAGVYPSLLGSIWVCAICALVALPVGVATAIWLEEFRPRRPWMRPIYGVVQLNITNLAGVPSVVYGILGLSAFVQMFGMFGSTNAPAWEIGARHFDQFLTESDQVLLVPVESRNAPDVQVTPGMTAFTTSGDTVTVHVIGARERLPANDELLSRTLRGDAEGGRISREAWYHVKLPFGRSVLAGGLTLMLVILPIVIISTQESLRAVPGSLREGALGLGATRWQVVRNVTLPAAIPGIMTGSILAISRAIGEAAPMLMIAGIVFIYVAPEHLMDDYTVLPLQIYNWAQQPQPSYHRLAATGIMVLLVILLSFNSLAIIIRNRTQKQLS